MQYGLGISLVLAGKRAVRAGLLQLRTGGPLRAILRIASGISLVIIGVVGLILPIMPGWIFLIPGLVILAEYFPPAQRLLDWAKAKMESVKEKVKKP